VEMKRELTKNFTLDEFRCKCCGEARINLYLVERLQMLRVVVGQPIIVNSGYRCPAHNKAVRGSRGSRHLLGLAADIRVVGLRPNMLGAAIDGLMFNEPIGLGIYDTFVHFDVLRAKDKRWTT